MPIFCLGGGRGHPLSALKVNDFTLKKERKKLPWKTSSVSVVAGRVWTGTGRGTVFHPQMFSRPGLNWRYMKQGMLEHFFCNWSSNISWIIIDFTFPFCDMAKGETFGEGGRIFNIELLLTWEGSSKIPQPTFWFGSKEDRLSYQWSWIYVWAWHFCTHTQKKQLNISY